MNENESRWLFDYLERILVVLADIERKLPEPVTVVSMIKPPYETGSPQQKGTAK
jgi:hypothetical protein